MNRLQLLPCALLCLLSCACALPGGRSAAEAGLFEQLNRLEQGRQAEDSPEAAEAVTCPVTVANLSAGVAQEPGYICLSERRQRQMPLASALAQAEQAAAPVPGAELPPPCPTDRYLYLTEPGDRLETLARVIARPGQDWRAWAGVIRMRNAHCFSGSGALQSGCELTVPAVAEHVLAENFAEFWQRNMQLASGSPLQFCRKLWHPDDR